MKTAREIKIHTKNANKGTHRGAIQIQESVGALGYGRSVLVDKNGVAIAGNHVLEDAHERDAPVVVVETDGHELVVVRRRDLDLADENDKRAVELAIADNRTSEVGLEWDVDILQQEIASGADISKFFRDDELQALLEKQAQEERDALSDPSYFIKVPASRDQLERFSALRKVVEGDVAEILLTALGSTVG